jgi:ParB family chromosome partitioning protein
MYQTIPITSVLPAEDNVRHKLGDLKELAASIASVGVIEPLLVCPNDDGRFTVVAGHRRLAAAVQAGLEEVPCVIKELSDVERLETMIAENLARHGLSPIEEAQAYFRMVELAVPIKELARRLGRPAKHITGRLALLELPTGVQRKVEAGALGVSDAAALLAIKEHPDVIEELLTDGWDAGDLERAVIREVARIEADAKHAAATEALTAEGIKVIEEWSRFGRDARQTVALGSGHGELAVDRAEHDGEPCHAAHVTRNGEIVYLCIDPRRHRPAGGSGVQAPDGSDPTAAERRAAEREEARHRRALDRERAEFTTGLAGRRLPKSDVTALVLDQFLATASNAQARSACKLLAIDAPTDDFGAAHQAALVDHASVSGANRERAALALALAIGEDTVRGFDPNGRTGRGRRHLDFLAGYGWGDPTTDPDEASTDATGECDDDPDEAHECNPDDPGPFPA